MKISELINELKKKQEIEGDLEAGLPLEGGWYDPNIILEAKIPEAEVEGKSKEKILAITLRPLVIDGIVSEYSGSIGVVKQEPDPKPTC